MTERQPPMRFGPFELRGGVIRRDRRVLRLPPKEMAVLKALVDARGGMSTRSELMAAGWGRLDVTEASLTRCIHSLRRHLALEDGTEVIQTMHRHGFRLSLPVECGPSPDLSPPRGALDNIRTNSLAAFERYLQSIEFMGYQVESNLNLARRSLLEAVELDPSYVGAWNRLADLEITLCLRGLGQTAREHAGEARVATERALALDRDNALAHAANAFLDTAVDGRELRLDAFDRAATAAPGDPGWRVKRAWLLAGAGELELALADLARSLRLRPLDQSAIFTNGYLLLCAGRADEAMNYLSRATEELPMADGAWLIRAFVAGWSGRHAEAIQAGTCAAEIARGLPTMRTGLAYALAKAGDLTAAAGVLRDIDGRHGLHAAPTFLAAVHAAMGDLATARRMLDRARETGCPFRALARFDPRLHAVTAADSNTPSPALLRA